MEASFNKVNPLFFVLPFLLILSECKKESDPETDYIKYSSTEGKIGNGGGEITVNDPNSPLNGVSVLIPNGALEQINLIEISQSTSTSGNFNGSEGLSISLLPHGLQFKTPVKVTIPLNEVDFNDPIVIYYDEDNQIIEKIEPILYDSDANLISFETNHFSNFSCAERYSVYQYKEEYLLKNEIVNFNDKLASPQSIFFKEISHSIGWTYDYTNYGFYSQGALNGYPHIMYGFNPCDPYTESTTPNLPYDINSIAALLVEFDASLKYLTNPLDVDLVLDIWLTNSNTPTVSNITGEIMIWEYKGGITIPGGTANHAVKVNKQVINIDGINYDLYVYNHETFPGCEIYNFMPTVSLTNTRNRKIDVIKFINELKKQSQIQVDHKFISSITFGNEIWYGKGSAEIYNYSIDFKSYRTLINNTTWDVTINFNTEYTWHADVTFNTNGTTRYDEPAYPGLYLCYGTWSLSGNQIHWDIGKGTSYVFDGIITGNTMSGTFVYVNETKTWSAIKK